MPSNRLRSLVVVASLGLAAAAAQAHTNVQWSIGINAPLAPGVALGTVVSNGPLYAAPVYAAPVYAAPVYAEPVYLPPAPVVYTPAPVYVAPRPIYAAPVPYVVRHRAPGWRGWQHHRHDRDDGRVGWR
ncbi:MAG TPA: hypothetical protein VLU41_01310 [Ideonella sp.]|nr:hypothetical protein [Ideonella sp.]